MTQHHHGRVRTRARLDTIFPWYPILIPKILPNNSAMLPWADRHHIPDTGQPQRLLCGICYLSPRHACKPLTCVVGVSDIIHSSRARLGAAKPQRGRHVICMHGVSKQLLVPQQLQLVSSLGIPEGTQAKQNFNHKPPDPTRNSHKRCDTHTAAMTAKGIKPATSPEPYTCECGNGGSAPRPHHSHFSTQAPHTQRDVTQHGTHKGRARNDKVQVQFLQCTFGQVIEPGRRGEGLDLRVFRRGLAGLRGVHGSIGDVNKATTTGFRSGGTCE